MSRASRTSKTLPVVKAVNIPIALYKSLQNRYYVGYADNLSFGKGRIAWARLYNPPESGRRLHVNVWTAQGLLSSPFRVQIWFNSVPPGTPKISRLVTPANVATQPPPKPRILLQYASDVSGTPYGGIKAFVRRGEPESTIVAEEDGKFIFGPGQWFLVTISNPETPTVKGAGRIALGWWEEPLP
jgi:hypothetical protein